VDIDGEFAVDAAREEVWQRLNDVRVLARCIPGCVAMQQVGAQDFECQVVAKFGPVKADFKTTITVSNSVPPASYTLSGRGQGGAAGFGEGRADVELVEHAGGTLIRYRAQIIAGGKIAQVGARLLSSTTRKLAEQFFSAFAAACAGEATSGAARADAVHGG